MINLILLITWTCIVPSQADPECDKVKFNFGNKIWTLPTTVEKAYSKYNLSYKPPGYYYRIERNETEVILDYHSEALDFDNEYQAKEVLFPRRVHSIIFQIPENIGTYDSLTHIIESDFKNNFVLTKGRKEGVTLLEHERPFEYNFLKVNNCLTIGIKRSVSESHGNIITVRFMYNLSLGYMGTIMGSY